MYSNKYRWEYNQQVAYALYCPSLVEDEKFLNIAIKAMSNTSKFIRYLENLWFGLKTLSDINCSYRFFKTKCNYLEEYGKFPYFYLKTRQELKRKIQWIEFDLDANETNFCIEYPIFNPFLAYRDNNAFIEYIKDKLTEFGWENQGERFYRSTDFADFWLIMDGFAEATGTARFFLFPFIKIRWKYAPRGNRP